MTLLRLRLLFAGLAIALAIPGALLVRRALVSVALEREARERAVAERVFDEMERALSELLAAEEARPVGDYDFTSAASPLRERPAGALALGWFQIEADGRVSAPAWASRVVPLAVALAQDGAKLETSRPRSEAVAALPTRSRTKPRLERHDGLDTGTPEAPKPKPDLAPVPPSPIELSPPQGVGEEYSRDLPIPSVEKDAGKAAASQDAYGALAKLNTGAKEREQRTQRVYVEEQSVEAASRSEQAPSAESSARARSAELVAQAMAAAPPRDRAASASSSGVADARERAKPEDARAEAETPVDATSSEPVAPPAPAPAQPEAKRELGAPGARRVAIQAQPEPPRAATPAASEWVRVVVDPLRGRLARSGELLLVRSAWIGARGVRQGVAFEVPALERTLAGAALGDGALPGARVQLAPAPRVSASPSDREGFSHRFAEPFDALAATLALPPFADAAGRTVYWLAALFCLAGAGGLFAAYRTTTVALHFAERRSNFAAAVSHELKTPLTAIRLYAEMLRDGLVSGDEKRREYYGSITAEAERLSRLINNVLEFSRLEKGARTLTLSAGDLGPAVREAVELLRPHAAEHGLALELAIEEGLPAVRFERDALLQILFNLIDNAIKYGRGKPASIEISCRRAAGGVALAVRDHGPGVPREELGRILEPFYRRGDELTRSAPGAGIGLALVRSLAQRMGAALVLRNAVPSGLEASLTLPAA